LPINLLNFQFFDLWAKCHLDNLQSCPAATLKIEPLLPAPCNIEDWATLACVLQH
jgi:hypothetical protein